MISALLLSHAIRETRVGLTRQFPLSVYSLTLIRRHTCQKIDSIPITPPIVFDYGRYARFDRADTHMLCYISTKVL